jgi:hypothetical protein
LQGDVIIFGDEEALTGCTVGAAVLDAKRRSVTAEAGTELDAEVGAGDFDRGRAVVVDERLGL